MAIRLHVEDEHAIPLSVSGGNDVEMKHSEAFINAISPTARVDQTEDGAVITITDKNGTTTAELSNGSPGPAGPQGPKGDTGEQGPKGDTGEQGPQGSDADIIKFLPMDSASGAIASFTDGADNVPLKSLVVGINPVQSGEGDPSPDNVRPISGWTGMTVNANGTEIPISWESEAGTVYGGVLDVLTGVLTVNKRSRTYNGTGDTWTIALDGDVYRAQTYPGDIKSIATSKFNVIANMGKTTSDKVVGAVRNYLTRLWYFPPTGITTLAEFNAWLAENPLQVVYDLAEPIEIQLDPHEVESLYGQNNIYADTGDTAVEYRADIQKWVEKKLSTRSTVSLTRSVPVQTDETDTELSE